MHSRFISAQAIEFTTDKIVVALCRGAFGSHVGLAYHSLKDGPRLLHLKFHKDVANESFPPTEDCWIGSITGLPDVVSKQLVAYVRGMAGRIPEVNFGIDFIAARGAFNASGKYEPPPGSDGLTCATFVSEIFRAAAIPLINEETWEYSDENVKWGHDVCELLIRVGATPSHVAAVQDNIKGLRVRPEEVAAASTLPGENLPAVFEWASFAGSQVMHILTKICS